MAIHWRRRAPPLQRGPVSMANVRVNGSGKLFFDFYYQRIRCREYTLLTDTAANRRLVAQTCKRIEKEISSGTFSYRKYFPSSNRADMFEPAVTPVAPPTREKVVQVGVHAVQAMRGASPTTITPVGATPLFVEFANQWYDEREIDWKRSNQLKVCDILNKHLITRFRGRRIGDISKAGIMAFRNHLAKDYRDGQGLSHARINGILNVLRQILEEGADRFQFATPYRGIKPLRVGKTVVDPFSLEEVKQILTGVVGAHRSFYTVAFFTAMRTSELLGLKWDCVDFERSQILVRETWVCGALDTPKTNGSERTIEMSSPVTAALRLQRTLTQSIGSAFAFCATNGQPMSRHNLANRIWRPTLKALGLRHRRPYQTRHTAATLWLAAGEAPEWISKQMGHTSTKMLFTVYSRYVPNLTRKDGSLFELLVGGRFGGAATPAQPEADSHAE